jgi:hypothetical protein
MNASGRLGRHGQDAALPLESDVLKRVPADLNRRDSQMVIDERVFGH